jgi:hypothetical protein
MAASPLSGILQNLQHATSAGKARWSSPGRAVSIPPGARPPHKVGSHVARRDSRTRAGPRNAAGTSPEETPRLPGPGEGRWARSPGVSRQPAARALDRRRSNGMRPETRRAVPDPGKAAGVWSPGVSRQHAAKRSTARGRMAYRREHAPSGSIRHRYDSGVCQADASEAAVFE